MRHSIAHAITACLTAFLVLLLPATGQHRRTTTALTPPPRPEDMDLPSEDVAPHPDQGVPNPAPDDDPYPVVPWYIVLADSEHWRNNQLAQRNAVRFRRAQALLDGDGMETCWPGCPCQRLPATAS